MKKKIAVIGVVALVVSLGLFIYNQIIAKAFRYSTPTEAFSNSSQRDSELTDILEDQDVALLIYKKKDGAYSDHVIAKDSRGWVPMSINYKNRRQISQDNGFIYLKEVQKKNVVQIVTIVEANENLPAISDSMKSTFLSSSYELDSGRKLLYGFLVSEEKFPDDYKIKLGDQEIPIY